MWHLRARRYVDSSFTTAGDITIYSNVHHVTFTNEKQQKLNLPFAGKISVESQGLLVISVNSGRVDLTN
jgi:hypothetical protein